MREWQELALRLMQRILKLQVSSGVLRCDMMPPCLQCAPCVRLAQRPLMDLLGHMLGPFACWHQCVGVVMLAVHCPEACRMVGCLGSETALLCERCSMTMSHASGKPASNNAGTDRHCCHMDATIHIAQLASPPALQPNSLVGALLADARPYKWVRSAKSLAPKQQRGAALCRAVEMTARLLLCIQENAGRAVPELMCSLAAGAMTWPDIQAMLGFASGQMDTPQAAMRIFPCWSALLTGYRDLVERHDEERYQRPAVPELNDPRSAARFQILLKLLAKVLLQSEPLASALLRLQPSSAAGSSSDGALGTPDEDVSSKAAAYMFGLQLVVQAAEVHRGETEEAQAACLQVPLLQHWLGHCTVLAQAAQVSSRLGCHT